MSGTSGIVSLVHAPWKEPSGQSRGTPLPPLTSETIEGLKPTFPGTLNGELEALLARTCGLEGTVLGSLDFTGQWHSEEPLAIFRPCLTLAIDAEGRRWVAEGATGAALPGPVWCILPEPQVALCVSKELTTFLEELRHKTLNGEIGEWLEGLTREARIVWKHRLRLASRPGRVSDPDLHEWVAALPPDSYIYDLRGSTLARGWPYGVAGPGSRLYRCGRAPVFAVSGPPASDRWARHLTDIARSFPIAQPAAQLSTSAFRAMPWRATQTDATSTRHRDVLDHGR